MSSIQSTIWPIEPHTQAKHLILRKYLEAWSPILSRWHGRVIYYDGFAGPGRYTGGEDGSPIHAIKVACDHRTVFKSELIFVFVEEREDRCKHLIKVLSELTLPSNFKYKVYHKSFADALSTTLDFLDDKSKNIAPTFAFIDPFGIKGLPYQLIDRLLSHKRCDILITFMNDTIKRFATELPHYVNELIGNSEASEIIRRSSNRILEARKLYSESLLKSSKFVSFFEMRNMNNQPIYDLFFATNSEYGHYKMKEAMWKADESGEYSFSDGIDPGQATIFGIDIHKEFAKLLLEQFSNETVSINKVLGFVRDKTPYLEKHARKALKNLEENEDITVAEVKSNGTKRRSGTFPESVSVRFNQVISQ